MYVKRISVHDGGLSPVRVREWLSQHFEPQYKVYAHLLVQTINDERGRHATFSLDEKNLLLIRYDSFVNAWEQFNGLNGKRRHQMNNFTYLLWYFCVSEDMHQAQCFKLATIG